MPSKQAVFGILYISQNIEQKTIGLFNLENLTFLLWLEKWHTTWQFVGLQCYHLQMYLQDLFCWNNLLIAFSTQHGSTDLIAWMHFTSMLLHATIFLCLLYIIFVIVSVVLYVQEQDLSYIKRTWHAEMNISTRLNDWCITDYCAQLQQMFLCKLLL